MNNSSYGRQGLYVEQTQSFATASQSSLIDRLSFIRNTYFHLACAIALFATIEYVMLNMFPEQIAKFTTSIHGLGWLLVLGGFMVVSWIANWWAHSSASRPMQYAGLLLYTVAEAVMFLPLLFIANKFAPGTIGSAAVVTGIIFGGLTLTVFITKADFSFLRMGLTLGGLAAFAFILVSMVMGLDILGALFATLMIVLASGYILYHTSQVVHHYRPEQYVAASLTLFASVALLFWYVLRLFMELQRD